MKAELVLLVLLLVILLVAARPLLHALIDGWFARQQRAEAERARREWWERFGRRLDADE